MKPVSPSDAESDRDHLPSLTREVLSFDGPPGLLANTIASVVRILKSTASFRIDPGLDIAHGESRSSGGLAISPTTAAMCADDFQRTAIFLRGLHGAIADVLERIDPPRPVRILYAGSGPYATLAVPLMSLFPPEQAQFTILDIHENSIASVKSIVEALGLADRVTAFEVTDACLHTIPPDQIPDIIVSETMNAALEKEPQVAIMRHLMTQAPGAVMVPENVRVDAFLLDLSKEFAFSPAPPPSSSTTAAATTSAQGATNSGACPS